MTALRQRMLEDMQVRQLSPHTQRAYVNNIAQFARYFGRSPDALGPDEIRAYQVVTESDPTRHAELLLASEACRRFDPETRGQATLYTSTEPCVMCCGAIYWSRIARVVFGCSAVALGALTLGSLVIPSREVFGAGTRQVEVIGPVIEAEALVVYRAYWSAR